MGQVVIGTAGHIDHGKTSLVEALTGTNTDSLDEERTRGMTINLGFAYLNEDITIIDVPGHEKFVRNMVAGVSTIDVALLVVAADDGIMPQTREHVHILSHLGISKCVVALTKTDRVKDAEWIELVTADIRELLKETPFPEAPILPTSTLTGDGIEKLRQALVSDTDAQDSASKSEIFRMPIDRVFHKKGFGVVVTGTVLSGSLKKGDDAEALPACTKVKARGVQTHLAETHSVSTGDRAAINVSGIEANQLWRGCELHSLGWIEPTHRLAVRIQMLPDTRWKLKDNQRIRLHIGTAEVLGRVQLYESKTLMKGGAATVLIMLEKPISAAMEDKLILRSYSPMDTIAGGVVLDPHPPKGKIIRKWLNELSENKNERLSQRVLYFHNDPKPVQEYARLFHLPESVIKSMAKTLGLSVENGLVLHPDSEAGNREIILKYLMKYHQENPYKKSVNADTIQTKLNLSENIVKMMLADLVKTGNVKEAASGFALANHKVILNSDNRKEADAISHWIQDRKFQLSKAQDVSDHVKLDEKKVLALLHILKDEGAIISVGEHFWIHTSVTDVLRQNLTVHFKSHSSLDVNAFKEITGTTRKSAIPLLEFCDKKQWTDRDGNVRVKGNLE